MTITIGTGNAAFDSGNKGREIARILRELADKIEEYGDAYGATLRDINGNTVGHVRGK